MRVLRIPGHVSWYPLNETIVVLDLKSSQRHVLKGAAVALWPRLGKSDGATSRELAQFLVSRYGIDRDVAARDVVRLVKDLIGSRLLHACSIDRPAC